MNTSYIHELPVVIEFSWHYLRMNSELKCLNWSRRTSQNIILITYSFFVFIYMNWDGWSTYQWIVICTLLDRRLWLRSSGTITVHMVFLVVSNVNRHRYTEHEFTIYWSIERWVIHPPVPSRQDTYINA